MKEIFENLLNIYNTYSPIMIFGIKLFITIFLLILIFKCYFIFMKRIKEHEYEARVYQGQRKSAEIFDRKNSKRVNEAFRSADPAMIDYINRLAAAYNKEQEMKSNDIMNLIKSIAIPLGALSVVWLGVKF